MEERRDHGWLDRRLERLEERLEGMPDRLAVAVATALIPITDHLNRVDTAVARDSDRIAALEIWQASVKSSLSTSRWFLASGLSFTSLVVGALLSHYLG